MGRRKAKGKGIVAQHRTETWNLFSRKAKRYGIEPKMDLIFYLFNLNSFISSSSAYLLRGIVLRKTAALSEGSIAWVWWLLDDVRRRAVPWVYACRRRGIASTVVFTNSPTPSLTGRWASACRLGCSGMSIAADEMDSADFQLECRVPSIRQCPRVDTSR